jgi:hypothetical protein
MKVLYNGEIMSPLTAGFDREHFIYIIGRNTTKATDSTIELQTEDIEDIDKRGDLVILFSLLNNPFELGGKYIELLMYGLNNGYLNIPIIYVAGEAMKTNDGKLLMNFLGGLYMSDYKKQWLEVLLENPVMDIEKTNIEMYWFNKDIKQIVERLTNAAGKVEYSNLDTLGTVKHQIYPQILNKIKQLGVHMEFYKTEEACRVRDAVARYEGLKGKKSTVATIALKKYMSDSGSGMLDLKPEYSNYKQQQLSIDEMIGNAVAVSPDEPDNILDEDHTQSQEQPHHEEQSQEQSQEQPQDYNVPSVPKITTDDIVPNPVASNEPEPSIMERLFNTVVPQEQPKPTTDGVNPTPTPTPNPSLPQLPTRPDAFQFKPATQDTLFNDTVPTTTTKPQEPSALQPIALTGGSSGGTRKNRSMNRHNKSRRSLFSYA